MDSLLQKTEPRLVVLVAISLISLTLLASYLYLFKQPIALLKQHEQTLELLKSETEKGASIGLQNSSLSQQLVSLESKFNANGQQLSKSQMIAYVIGQLDAISERHHVQLVSVVPGNVNPVFMFEELPFNVQITGEYFDIYAWLNQVEVELGPMIVKSFKINGSGAGSLRKMNLVMVSYVPKGDL